VDALRLCDSEPPEAIMLFGLPLDIILQGRIDCQLRGRREHGCLAYVRQWVSLLSGWPARRF
jgi:hypothetical protein